MIIYILKFFLCISNGNIKVQSGRFQILFEESLFEVSTKLNLVEVQFKVPSCTLVIQLERFSYRKWNYSWSYPFMALYWSVIDILFCNYSTNEFLTIQNISGASFYPTALKGCRGIVFTHGVRMGGQVGGRREIVCPGCISETVRCRKLILGRDIG